ncbi:MAG: MBL fold metallo-hydrolase [Clostridia bacterium]|nr:MBL fold metallo-hydrolase [Clostridia bacterium]
MSKKIAAFALSIMMVFTMTPMIAFANPEDEVTEPETIEEVVIPEEEDVTETPKLQEEPELEIQEEAEELKAEAEADADSLLTGGKFYDDGAEYVMEDISGYSKSMNIYSFYLGTGEYGDAVLIESNGKYLLMDVGHKGAAGRLVSCLNQIGVKELDIYISHVHGDHTGGLEAVCTNFKVNRIFAPDIELCENYVTPNVHKSVDKIYAEHINVAKLAGIDVVYLRPSARTSAPRAKNTYSQFNVGGVSCSVVGPLGTYKPSDFTGYVKELNGHCGTEEGHCLNNSSLCTIMTCGSTKYLATGDIEKHEEAKLVSKYRSGLDASIMKMPHHGLRTSCTSGFASKVTPMWSFAQNHGFTGNINKSAINVAKGYGYLDLVASNRRSLIFTVNNNRVRVYRDYNNNSRPDDGLITGWVSCGGGTQYYDGAGYIHTGWNWLSGYLYYMSGSSGFRYTGSHTINGVKVKFNSYGKLTSHSKPAKVKARSAKGKKGGKIMVSWRKASRASSYQVYRATSKNGTYVYLGTYGKGKRSITNGGLVKGKRYYYKVRALRNVAGGTMYGSFSNVKSAKAK